MPIKRTNFRFHLMIGWWILWLVISQTTLSIVVPPSTTAIVHFVVLLTAFAVGFCFVRLTYRASASNSRRAVVSLAASSPKIRWMMYGLGTLATLLLLTSLYRAGAFTTSFMEYFAKLRVGALESGELTGIKLLETLTKVFAFPVSYGLILMILGAGVRHFRLALAICLLNFALFCYLWQVNYPIIHLFWLAFFYLLSQHSEGVAFNRRTLIGLALAFALLVLSAMNRYGSDDGQLFGALQRYVVGYHLIGFSFYDFQLADPNSILHAHSFGRSSLGFLEQIVEHVSRLIGVDFIAASSENSTYNDNAVAIGIASAGDFNAFGTLAFTLYRDLGVIGILIGGFLYGGVLSFAMLKLRRNWMAAGVFYLLASAWMMGMMVSPVEQTYFWFCLVFLASARLVSKRWRIVSRSSARSAMLASSQSTGPYADRESKPRDERSRSVTLSGKKRGSQ